MSLYWKKRAKKWSALESAREDVLRKLTIKKDGELWFQACTKVVRATHRRIYAECHIEACKRNDAEQSEGTK